MPDYSSLPSVTALASIPELAKFPETVRIRASKKALKECRIAMESGKDALDPTAEALRSALTATIWSPLSVRNFSGVILHTGLGRAPLDIQFSMSQSISGYTSLEFDLASGKRGDRQDHLRTLLCDLTGAEDALVVNNGAGAVLLALSALCGRKEVLLSRGQSVEIGGAFRMPDVIKASGCKLVDVGTTNKTNVQDYLGSITPRTAAILQCHPSNFEVRGFTSTPSTKELAEAAHAKGILFINDQGNGALIDFKKYGIHGIETLPQSVAAGADITIGSGDKLLGGPQCGIILGRKDLIAKLAKHPLARALRIDKVGLHFLKSTLTSYAFQDFERNPLIRMLDIPPEEIKKWCEMLAPDGAEILETVTELGSGAAPGQGVKSYAIVMASRSPDKLLAELRDQSVIGRIHKGKVWLDPRTASKPQLRKNKAGEITLDVSSQALKNYIGACWEKWK